MSSPQRLRKELFASEAVDIPIIRNQQRRKCINVVRLELVCGRNKIFEAPEIRHGKLRSTVDVLLCEVAESFDKAKLVGRNTIVTQYCRKTVRSDVFIH